MITKIKELINILGKKAYFFDLDGTIYLGNRLFEGVHPILDWLKDSSKYFYFLSNNSSRSTSQYLAKLNKLGLDIKEHNIILSQHPTIKYLEKEGYKKIFLMGNQSLKEEFKQHGFIITEEEPEILVLAFDQEFTYDRLVKASYLLQEGIPYIATHPDNRCPTERGYIPDAGGTAALLERATGRLPRVFGKPNKDMILFKLDEIGVEPQDAIMFGDRLYTDIRMGKEANVTTCCVLSGETKINDIEQSEFQPDYIIEGIWVLKDFLKTQS